jgi:hypothetical protein
MKQYKVLHISQTPLVDSPRKISECTNLYTNYHSDVIVFNDYPGKMQGIFSSGVLLFDKVKKRCLSIIKSADIIFIHNFLNNDQEEIVFKHSNSDAKFVYQAHSPLREGPVFTKYASSGGRIEFDERCVISQYQPRLYSDYTIVPNLILEKSSLNLLKEAETPVVLFSPAHSRTGGRWNDKTAPLIEKALQSMDQLGLIRLIVAHGYTPYDLFQIRKRSHITIDEIITGAFHQVSLEGLCAGNVVINNSDFFSDLMLKSVAKKDIDTPFFKASLDNFKERFMELILNHEEIRRLQSQSNTYFEKSLLPERLITHYERIYNRVILDD